MSPLISISTSVVLRVDSGSDALLLQFNQLVDRRLVPILVLGFVLGESPVAPVFAVIVPHMTWHRVAMTTELTHDFDEAIESTFVQLKGKARVRISMLIDNVADRPKVASASDIDVPCPVSLHRPFTDFHGLVLSPGFVEGDPADDGRMVFQEIDHPLELEHELSVVNFRPFGILGIGHEPRPGWIDTTADLVLPEQHSQSIAMIVVALWFDFDVLSNHVESCRL